VGISCVMVLGVGVSMAVCPHCGREVWWDTMKCPRCGTCLRCGL